MKRVGLFVLSIVLAASYVVTVAISAPKMTTGLSTIAGVTVLAGSGPALAFASLQLYASLALIGMLVFLQLTDPTGRGMKGLVSEARTNWLPYVVLLLFLYMFVAAFKISEIMSGT